MPTYRVIILEKREDANASFKVALWADVPLDAQPFYANPDKVSAWVSASAPDVQLIKDGSVVESVEIFSRAPGTTLSQVQADLEQRWQTFQDSITNSSKYQRYGTTWNGTTWTPGGF